MEPSTELPRRWDPIVKLTHWGIVAAVIGNALVTEEGSGWHIWVGYGLAALLALRLLWGLVGPREARFGAFPPSLARASRHVGEIGRGEKVRHRSHNPLGALMVYAIWGTLLVVIGSGVAMSGAPPADPSAVRGEHGEGGEGEEHEEASAGPGQWLIAPARADEGGEAGTEDEGEELFEEMHEIAVNLLYLLVALHLAGVAFETRRTGREVLGAMIPGGNRRS
ncbi:MULTISPECIES: cytochrome b/b6 domain-containing protein [unclassified Novosphingobium]|uniref:cytochrome b/b6 domain-containing protein n=1 Tax=unclassified Novosphingobium TaxID=2644732 RepID=UPI000EECD099|nr:MULTISPECIES: cytochrome b/b6 domain-containing protein [unclassified Novosphingobium]HCF24533.1 cytochrome B [Novosphingobium sp.]HQV03347.1 cytochrome b/b6 domain-containing protein [Novosphingobium sp.]